MKITTTVEATPEEVRTLLGLPSSSIGEELQGMYLKQLQENLNKNMFVFPMNLWNTTQNQTTKEK